VLLLVLTSGAAQGCVNRECPRPTAALCCVITPEVTGSGWFAAAHGCAGAWGGGLGQPSAASRWSS